MGSIRPAKKMVTGVTILVILYVAASTFAASITNSTDGNDSEVRRYCPHYAKGECAQVGLFCDDYFFFTDGDSCCCRFDNCAFPLITFSEWCWPGGLHIPFLKNGTTENEALAA